MLTQLFYNFFVVTGLPIIKEKPQPHRPLGRVAKTLDFRHRGGTKCRCDYCTPPYNRSQAKRELQAAIAEYYEELV